MGQVRCKSMTVFLPSILFQHVHLIAGSSASGSVNPKDFKPATRPLAGKPTQMLDSGRQLAVHYSFMTLILQWCHESVIFKRG
jgi:hypothetical protein